MNVVVCGAGIAGLTLAWWLRRLGHDVTLVEQASGPRDDGYMIDFMGAGFDVAERMGLLRPLAEAQTRNTIVRYIDEAGHARGSFAYDRMAAALGGRLHTLMRGDLERALRTTLGTDVPIRYGETVDAVTERPDGVEVKLTDGSTLVADLLVGADGIHSRVRGLAFDAGGTCLSHLGYHTASYGFDDDELQARVGRRFLIVAAPDRQVGLYPTNEGRMVAWYVHRAGEAPVRADPRAAMRATYQRMGPLVDRALANCPEGFYYDTVAQVVMDRWAHGRVVLVGDACQAVSLLAGQGASLAMAGAYVLADELRDAPPEAACARYEQRMRVAVRTAQRRGRRTAGWLVPASHIGIAARGLALAAIRLPGGTPLARAALTPSLPRVELGSSAAESRSKPTMRTRTPPRGLARLAFRLPILIYRARLGVLFGRRLMLIEHIGRRTGTTRRTVVEVVEHRPEDGSYVIASGFGHTAQWYRNLVAHPRATVQVGRRRMRVVAVPLTAEAGGRVMDGYARRHPRTVRWLGKVLGVPPGTSDYRAVGEQIPFLRLRPVS